VPRSGVVGALYLEHAWFVGEKLDIDGALAAGHRPGRALTVVSTPVLDVDLDRGGPPQGPPVLLLHGWPDAPRGWSAARDRLHDLGYRTIVPALRGSAATRFHSADTPRDGRGVALAADAIDVLDALGLERVSVVGHDWGARVAYTLAALAPQRVDAIVTLALAYQPRGAFEMPSLSQARAFWYQWLMYTDVGVDAITEDPVGFARIQWDTWSPAGWFDDAEFAETARSFANPDWVPITLNAYRSRFLASEPCDPRYEPLAARLASIKAVATPTVMIQGGADYCDEPASSADQEHYFTGGYRRVLLDGVGHFPHREAPHAVAHTIHEHLSQFH
jgi:pimeloyl-ACP methyl ester carboxylesterase